MCGKASICIVAAVNFHAIWKSKSITVPEAQQRLQFASSASACSRAVFIPQTVQRAVYHQGSWGFISQAGFVSLRGMELSSLHQATLERFSVVNMPVHGTAVIVLLLEQKFMARKDRYMWCWVMRLTDLLSCS